MNPTERFDLRPGEWRPDPPHSRLTRSRRDRKAMRPRTIARVSENPKRTENVWHTDTGAGNPQGKLTIARTDTDAIETVSLPGVRAEQGGKPQ